MYDQSLGEANGREQGFSLACRCCDVPGRKHRKSLLGSDRVRTSRGYCSSRANARTYYGTSYERS